MAGVDAVTRSRARRPTLATIAAAAGVSVTTVSKVLNDHRDVAPETRALVRDMIAQHGYVGPSRRGVEGVPTGLGDTVEVVFDGEIHAYSASVLRGVVDAGAEAGVGVVVSIRDWAQPAGSGPDPAGWVGWLSRTGRKAVIVVTGELTAQYLVALERARLALVVVDPLSLPQVEVTSVGSTNFAGGLAATRHLLSLGHERIGYIGGPATASCNQARMHGYRAAMEGAELAVPPQYVRLGRFVYGEGVRLGAELLALPAPPTAIFAASDEVALGVIEATRVRGLRVPDDVSIVGFDDTDLAYMSSPPLTTIRQPLVEMGAVALRTALRLAAGQRIESHHVEFATELVVRGSTAPPAARATVA